MALTTATGELGTQAPDFRLPSPDGAMVSLDDVRGESGTLVMFICNHCPYVKAIADRIARDARDLQALGVGVAAIMPNDYRSHPDDAPDKMVTFSEANGFSFPYLVDETQETARAYGAVCTPDFFGYDGGGILRYRGRLDESRNMPAGPDARRDLFEAMKQLAETGAAPEDQRPSMGCSIKWLA